MRRVFSFRELYGYLTPISLRTKVKCCDPHSLCALSQNHTSLAKLLAQTHLELHNASNCRGDRLQELLHNVPTLYLRRKAVVRPAAGHHRLSIASAASRSARISPRAHAWITVHGQSSS